MSSANLRKRILNGLAVHLFIRSRTILYDNMSVGHRKAILGTCPILTGEGEELLPL
jgi:hypothetical protein